MDLDVNREFFEQRFARLRKDYVDCAKKIISSLQERGIDITYEMVLVHYDRPRANKIFVNNYIAEVLREVYTGKEVRRFHTGTEVRKWIKEEKFYVRDGEGIEKLDPRDAVRMIHEAGGYAVWAHPFITSENLRDEYFQELDVDAIEASYAYQENGYKGDEPNAELERIVREKIKGKGVLVSGGSDSHYPLKKV